MVVRFYNALISRGFPILAAATVGFTALATIYDVLTRELGLQSPAATSALLEYAMLLLTALTAPVLVRSNGHIVVDSLLRALPDKVARMVTASVMFVCLCLCLLISYYAFRMGLDAIARGEMDVRSIRIPRWVLYALVFTAFAASALEFGRILVRRDFTVLGRSEQGSL